MSVSINGTNGLTFNDGSAQTTAASGFGFKNRIINGAMVIDQRNAGASVTLGTNTYPSVDRWFWQNILGASFTATAQQNAGSVTPPLGFTNYLGLTSGGTFSPATDDMLAWKQNIEGYNVSDLAWGTADAKPITISFWVRSSLTGTFSGAVSGLSGGNSSWVFTYTISAANTWEYKTIHVDGNTTTAPTSTTNGIGFQLRFAVSSGSGTTYASSTTGQWTTGNLFGIPNSTNVLGTNGATWYITGVQLEKGSTATSFDYRPYGTELALCQRYYWTLGGRVIYLASYGAASLFITNVFFPVSMRATPTITNNLSGSPTVPVGSISPLGFGIYNSTAGSNFDAATATAEL